MSVPPWLDVRVGPTYDLLGYRVAIATPDDEVARACASVLREFVAAPDPDSRDPIHTYSVYHVDGQWHVEEEGQTLQRVADLAAVPAAVEWRIVNAALKHRADLIHIHGAALAVPECGTCVILAGASGVGKTTLALRLMEGGFLPFSDDVTLIEPVGLNVLPFRRAFHVAEKNWHPPTWASGPLPVAAVLILARAPDGRARAVTLGPSVAASALLEHCGSLVAAPSRTLAVTARLVGQVRCSLLELGSPGESAAVVESLRNEWCGQPTKMSR
jgi:hypothetical protein